MASTRAITKLAPNECAALLGTTEVGRLAIALGGEPEIFPVNYVIDNGDVVFVTAEGTKLAAALTAGIVAFETDGYDEASGVAWSVVVKGQAVEISMYDQPDEGAFGLQSWTASPKSRFVRIAGDEITGRRFAVVGRHG